jgi:hypothetical protein
VSLSTNPTRRKPLRVIVTVVKRAPKRPTATPLAEALEAHCKVLHEANEKLRREGVDDAPKR